MIMGKKPMISYHYVVDAVCHSVEHVHVVTVLAIDICAKETLPSARIGAIEAPDSL